MRLPVDARQTSNRSLIGLSASLFLVFGQLSARAAEALAVLEAGKPQIVSIEEGQTPLWICRNESPSIVWFFASTPEPSASVLFRNASGRTGNPLWVRTQGQGHIASVRLSAATAGRAAKVRIWAETEPEFDPAEPNDGFTQARPLPISGEARLYLYPKDDQDWYLLTIRSNEEHRVEIVLPAPGAAFRDGLELGICDVAERPLVQRVGTANDKGLWRTIPFQLDPGDYRLWVRARGARSSRSPLSLRLISAPVSAPEPAPVVVEAKPAPPPAPLVKAPPEKEPPPVPAPVVTREKSPLEPNPWPWIFLGSVVIVVVWLASGLTRPRRVFDLTR